MNIAILEGNYKGAILGGVLRDLSEGGMCVELDGGVFERGTPVQVECDDGLMLCAWVCHYTRAGEISRLGLSFDSVSHDLPQHRSDTQLDKAGTQ